MTETNPERPTETAPQALRQIRIGEANLTVNPVPDGLVEGLDLVIGRAENDGSNLAYRNMLRKVVLTALKRVVRTGDDQEAVLDEILDGHVSLVDALSILLGIEVAEPVNREQRRQADRTVRRTGRRRGRRA